MVLFHFLYDSPENCWLHGGGAVRAHEINLRLVQMGHEVHMLCGGYMGARDKVVDGVHYHFTRPTRYYWLSRLIYSFSCRLIFKRWQKLNGSRCSLVVDDISAFTLVMPWRVWKGPVVGIVHHVLGEHAQRRFRCLGILIRRLERWNISRHPNLVTVSRATFETVKIIAPTAQIEIVYNGVSCPEIGDSGKLSKPYLLFLGRIDYYNKGIDILLDAFEKIAFRFPDLELVIAGSGKDEALLARDSQRLGNRVRVLGRVDDKEKWLLMAHAELFCMPSRFEGWGIAAVEAASCGCPVLASDIPGLNEAVLSNVSGELVSNPDPVSYATSLVMLLNDRAKRERMTVTAREWGLQWNWNAMALNQWRFYEKCL